jgi:hypothetical protein
MKLVLPGDFPNSAPKGKAPTTIADNRGRGVRTARGHPALD